MARTYRLTFMCTGGDTQLVQPSLHYQTDVPPLGDEPDPNDVAGAVKDHLQTAFRACFPSDATLHDVVALEETLPPDIGVAGLAHVGLAGTFSGSGAQIPEGLVPLVNLHTGSRSRSSRGWMHMPSPRYASTVSYDVWNSSILTALDAFAALLDDSMDLGAITPTHLNPVVYSRTRRQRSEDPYTFRLTGATVNRTPKWLRTRMTTP